MIPKAQKAKEKMTPHSVELDSEELGLREEWQVRGKVSPL